MAISIQFSTAKKRENSTKQLTMSATHNCTLKNGCSLLHPTLLLEIETNTFPTYTAFKIENRYYRIIDIRAVRANLFEIDGLIDVLATYRADILASSLFVSYSSSGTAKLADNRIPVLKDAISVRQATSLSLFDDNHNGCYILTVVGRNGCATYRVSQATLTLLIHDLQTWVDDQALAIKAAATDDFVGVSKSLVDMGVVGNTFQLAPQCIRNCVWTPFKGSELGGSLSTIYLGNYECKSSGGPLQGYLLPYSLYMDAVTVNIPWHYNDWRRGYCEDIYLYLPLVGMVQLSSDSILDESTITVKYAITPADGSVVYEVLCGNQIIGTYGGSCAGQYPIGINQFTSAGQNINSMSGGISKSVGSAIVGGKLGKKLGGTVGMAGGAIASAAGSGISMGYHLTDTAYTTNMTCIGGVGGGAGGGLDLQLSCYSVYHNTVVNPSDMQATMGLPTMKPMSLANLTGYCQCANAHIDANATETELEILDEYINSGFFIE